MGETRHDLRCECSSRPILCQYGKTKDDVPYVHIRTMRQQRILAEMVTYHPDCEIRCRNCGRWYSLKFRKGDLLKPEVNIDPPTEAIDNRTGC